MNKKHPTQSGFFNLRILVTLFLFAVAACALLNRPLLAILRSETSTNVSPRMLTFAERVAYQRAIEEVYWRHRIWQERPDPKPPLDAVMSRAQLEKKVADYLRKSQALEDYWQRPITAEQLQGEMYRMAQSTKQPAVLRELFEALADDPFVIAECLAKPVLTDRLIAGSLIRDETRWSASSPIERLRTFSVVTTLAQGAYTLPKIGKTEDRQCTDNTWRASSIPMRPMAGTSIRQSGPATT